MTFIYSCKQKKENIINENKSEIQIQKNSSTVEKKSTEKNEIKLTEKPKANSEKQTYKFTRAEILKTIKFYGENYGKETTSFDFVDYELDPKLYVLAKMVCDNNDNKLFEEFLKMVLASKGSASETPSDIFAEIYLCKPELMIDYLTNKYPDEYLAGQLEFGFENVSYGMKDEMKNYDKLKTDIEKLFEK